MLKSLELPVRRRPGHWMLRYCGVRLLLGALFALTSLYLPTVWLQEIFAIRFAAFDDRFFYYHDSIEEAIDELRTWKLRATAERPVIFDPVDEQRKVSTIEQWKFKPMVAWRDPKSVHAFNRNGVFGFVPGCTGIAVFAGMIPLATARFRPVPLLRAIAIAFIVGFGGNLFRLWLLARGVAHDFSGPWVHDVLDAIWGFVAIAIGMFICIQNARRYAAQRENLVDISNHTELASATRPDPFSQPPSEVLQSTAHASNG